MNPDPSQDTSLTLLERAKQQDSDAWGRLRDVYVPMIGNWCHRSGVPEVDIHDVTQEVFLAVHRNLARFRRDEPGQSFRKWLKSITRTKVVDFFRQRNQQAQAQGGTEAQQRLEQITAPEAPDHLIEQEEESILLQRAVELVTREYPNWYKLAFLFLVVEERSPEEVARVLSKKVSTVYVAKSRVLRRLKKEFADVLEFC